ncbi:MAG: aminotransferase class IV family protein [Planctomycetes bacterium]|nr:aminotransferase class IV family protein [Planctomycetota bacterium]
MPSLNVYFNGRIIPAGQACIGIDDAGFLHGASVFTTMLARNGRVFRLDRHIKRLLDTVAVLGLRTDAAAESLTAAAADLLAANRLKDARMRITLTPGGVHGEEASPTTTLVTAEPLPAYPPEWYEKGINAIVSSYRQLSGDPTCGRKTGCYFTRILAAREAAEKGAQEALFYTTDNRLAEACFCSVFLVLDGKVRTPPLDTPVLPGVVRQAVIELCSSMGIACDDSRPLTVHEMLSAGEAFVTASCSGIRPVVMIERHAVGDQRPGPVTKKIMVAYQDLVNKECASDGPTG